MRVVIFCHSLRSDWNHGNAHFLRGVASEFVARGHDVAVLEPRNGWSIQNLVADHGRGPLRAFRRAYPELGGRTRTYPTGGPDLDAVLKDADLVMVHEWTEPALVKTVGDHARRTGNHTLYFHDSHHRAVSAPDEMRQMDLSGYHGVLAFGAALRAAHLEQGWTDRAWTWHEAADPRRFRPQPPALHRDGDVVWIGNWGAEEREQELREFLLEPVRSLGLRGTLHGVRYPEEARRAVEEAGFAYRGWLANHDAPRAYARHLATVHVPRRPYLEALPGIPTIRMFEAFACGIPLAVARWRDTEGLFDPAGHLRAEDGDGMRAHLDALVTDGDLRHRLAERALRDVLSRHTCAHRVDELLAIDRSVRGGLRGAGLAANGNGRSPTDGAADGAKAPVPRAAQAAGGGGDGLAIAFFGSSLLSSHWNGAATYYRGLLRALADLGHRVTFYEPDAFGRQERRDMDPPPWAQVVVYPADGTAGAARALRQAQEADVVVKASGVGVHDAYLEREVLALQSPRRRVVYWDVDAPATLARVRDDPADPFHALVPRYDAVFTYGGGDAVVQAYRLLGARSCTPVYNALDPATHHPVPSDARFEADLAFLGNRLPDREARVEEFFLAPAAALPERRFLLGGAGWEQRTLPANVRRLGHVGTQDHNAFNSTPLAVLNVNRASMAQVGHSPPTRIFEAAGAGACIVTDAWPGIEAFLEPGREILVARDGAEVAAIVGGLTPAEARAVGDRARRRVLREHTYAHRAGSVDAALRRLAREVVAR